VLSLQADADDARNATRTQNELARLICEEAQRWVAAQPALAWAAGWPPMLHAFGSSACNLAQHGSGLDLTMLFEPPGATGSWCTFSVDAQRSLILHLHRVFLSVRQSGDTRWISVETVLHERSPCLRLVDARSRITVHLSVCEQLGLANTALLRVYSQLHPAFLQLTLFVKHWSYRRRLNGTAQQMLSSYGWSLLVLFAMQTAEPKALPNLQSAQLTASLPRKSLQRADGVAFDVTFSADTGAAHSSIGFNSETQLGFGQLLRRFFSLYASLDDKSGVVSVRTGVLQPRPGVAPSELHPELVCGPFAIEDPFEVTRDLGDALTDTTAAITRAELQRAHALLNNRAPAQPWAMTLGELLMPRI